MKPFCLGCFAERTVAALAKAIAAAAQLSRQHCRQRAESFCHVGLEASILGRMCGIPVIYGRQHGHRWDKGHALAYEWAYSLWAPYAAAMEQAGCPPWVREKTFYSGGFCRFTGMSKAAVAPPSYAKGKPNILVMAGVIGDGVIENVWPERWQRSHQLRASWAPLQDREAPARAARYIAQVAQRCMRPVS